MEGVLGSLLFQHMSLGEGAGLTTMTDSLRQSFKEMMGKLYIPMAMV
jgi:hypothetical protein